MTLQVWLAGVENQGTEYSVLLVVDKIDLTDFVSLQVCLMICSCAIFLPSPNKGKKILYISLTILLQNNILVQYKCKSFFFTSILNTHA